MIDRVITKVLHNNSIDIMIGLPSWNPWGPWGPWEPSPWEAFLTQKMVCIILVSNNLQ